ncbi:vesicular inhibitory amino acid transporter [Nematostella vectensis]|uniref:vesicular inhibitory amino acid transporter n=1 Tax=Nematostella vectensis TaxID=45351 RepID=UPI0020771202|nr:vesicular inhibitory amino acid transporter [Nematostella vectensis]
MSDPANNQSYLSVPQVDRYSDDDRYTDDERCSDDDRCSHDGKPSDDSEEGRSSMSVAMVNLVNARMPAFSLLLLPYFIQQGGVMAVIALVFVPCVCVYTGKILIECLYDTENHKRVRDTYKDIGEAVWPKYGGILVTVTQVIQLVLPLCLFLHFGANALFHVVPNFPVTQELLTVAAALLCLPLVYLKTLARVSWVSLTAVVFLLVALLTVLYYCGLMIEHKKWTMEELNIWNFQWVLMSLTIASVTSTHGVLPTLESTLSDRSKFNRILGLSYALSQFTMLTFSLIAFFAFRQNLENLITGRLVVGKLRVVMGVFLFANAVSAYPFNALVLFDVFKKCVIPKNPSHLWPSCNVLKAWLVLLTLIPAIALPHLRLLVVIIGSFCNITITLLLPCYFHLKLKGEHLSYCQTGINYAIIIWALAVGVTSLIASAKNFVEAFL